MRVLVGQDEIRSGKVCTWLSRCKFCDTVQNTSIVGKYREMAELLHNARSSATYQAFRRIRTTSYSSPLHRLHTIAIGDKKRLANGAPAVLQIQFGRHGEWQSCAAALIAFDCKVCLIELLFREACAMYAVR